MRIERQEKSKISMSAKDIPIGVTFTGIIQNENDDSNSIFLKGFDIIIDLYQPDRTWPNPKFKVQNYQPVDAYIVVK